MLKIWLHEISQLTQWFMTYKVINIIRTKNTTNICSSNDTKYFCKHYLHQFASPAATDSNLPHYSWSHFFFSKSQALSCLNPILVREWKWGWGGGHVCVHMSEHTFINKIKLMNFPQNMQKFATLYFISQPPVCFYWNKVVLNRETAVTFPHLTDAWFSGRVEPIRSHCYRRSLTGEHKSYP